MKHNYTNTCNDLKLVPLAEEHIEDMRILRNENRFCFIYSNIISADEQKNWFNSYLNKENDYVFSVFVSDVWVGVSSIYNVANGSAEFGRLMIDKSKVKKDRLGLATTLCTCDLAFKQLNLKKITLQVYKENIPAYKTYLNAGFITTATEKDSNGQELVTMELLNKYHTKGC